MKLASYWMLFAAVVPIPVNAAPAAPDIIYAVCYVDALASSGRRTARILEQYRDQSRREPGALGIDVFAQKNQPGGFAVLEVWRDKAAFETHGKAAATERFRRAMQAWQLGPWDVHAHSDYHMGSSTIDLPRGLTLLVHVDVIPTFIADYQRILDDYVNGARGERGLLRLAVLQSLAPRTNHFTVIEDWRDEAALEAHRKTAGAQRYREALAPELGALYDERAYNELK